MTRAGQLSGWRLAAARVVAIAFVVAITLYIVSIRDEAERLAAYGYPGIFVLSILANATVILPAPGVAITFAMGGVFHPIGVALAAGSGAALGELTGYLAGFSGRGVAARAPVFERLAAWTMRNGGWAVMLMAFIPNPFFDVAGAAAGALRMPIAKFLAWAWVGKVLKMLLFAYAGSASIDWLARLLG